MAIYHLSVKHGSRKQGKSAAAHANYITRQGNYVTGRYAEDFVHAESWNMPAWGEQNAINFWQAADTHERANGRLYTEIEIALPREMNQTQQLNLVRRFVSEQVGDAHPVTWAVHNCPALDGGMNPHAHIMLSERALDGVERNAELFFKRANAAHPEKGGAAKDPAWNDRDKVEQLRRGWEVTANRVLLDTGLAPTLERKSLEARGIDRAPEPKLGPEQTAMLRRGEVTEDAEQVLTLRQDRAQAAVLHRRIIETEKRVAKQQQEAPEPEEARQPPPMTPEQIETAVEPQSPEAAFASPESAAHRPEPQRQRQAPPSEPEPESKTHLPDDLAGLEAMWQQEAKRYFEPLQKRGERIWEKAAAEKSRCHYASLAHNEAKPQAPQFLAWFRQGGYERRLEAWQKQRDEIDKRYWQMEKRMDFADCYRLEGLRRFGGQASIGELVAEKRLRADQPELWGALKQTRSQEHQRRIEKLNQEMEQRRQRERDRDCSQGLER